MKTVIRERNNKKMAKVEEKMFLYQREITQDVNGHYNLAYELYRYFNEISVIWLF